MQEIGDEEVMDRFGSRRGTWMGIDFTKKKRKMVIVNVFFETRQEHWVTYKSGGRSAQIDYILCRRCHLKEITNCVSID